jgi:hypothetical protein
MFDTGKETRRKGQRSKPVTGGNMKRQIYRIKQIKLAVGCLLALAPSSLADTRKRPEHVSFYSRDFTYVAEVFPPELRQNKSKKLICYFYQMGYRGKQWEVRPKLLWKAEFVNDLMPLSAVISMGQGVFTLDEQGRVGYQNAVVIYNEQGQRVKRRLYVQSRVNKSSRTSRCTRLLPLRSFLATLLRAAEFRIMPCLGK